MQEIKLRPYQIEGLDAIKEAESRGVKRVLVCLPTGTGKTFFFIELAKRLEVPTLIIAHTNELILQARINFLKYGPMLTMELLREKEMK